MYEYKYVLASFCDPLQRGRVIVNKQMQVPKFPHIMAIGDLIEGVSQINTNRIV